MGKTARNILTLVGFCSAMFFSNAALAERINGKVSYIGTQNEYHTSTSGYHAVFRFRVSESVCGNDKTPKDRWVKIRSGRMDGAYAHNSANFKNAYSTVMASLLSGKTIEVDGAPNCNAGDTQTINLWGAAIGLYK